jgi:membrane-associated protein
MTEWLSAFIAHWGLLAYGVLFAVIFLETGLVVTPFLPGDSLLFAAGALAALGSLNVFWLFLILAVAAIAGDTMNYWIGRKVGLDRFVGKGILFLKLRPEHIQQTEKFFERYGSKTIVLARFVPIVRTMAPFVAGLGQMNYTRFLGFNVVGGAAWVALFTLGGFYFGNLPLVRDHFELVIVLIIFVSVIPPAIEFLRSRKGNSPVR